jgi:hypothetical protein
MFITYQLPLVLFLLLSSFWKYIAQLLHLPLPSLYFHHREEAILFEVAVWLSHRKGHKTLIDQLSKYDNKPICNVVLSIINVWNTFVILEYRKAWTEFHEAFNFCTYSRSQNSCQAIQIIPRVQCTLCESILSGIMNVVTTKIFYTSWPQSPSKIWSPSFWEWETAWNSYHS